MCVYAVGWGSGGSHYMSPCQLFTAVFSFTIMTF